MPREHQLDALVVGTGFGGIHALYALVKEGLNAKAIDTASDVGGTCYPFSRLYVNQPEILDYLRHVVTKYDLRRHMQSKTEMLEARWDNTKQRWVVKCATGDIFCVKYLVTALGVLHHPNIPDIPGIDQFKGKVVHTSSWDPSISLNDKRVGVIGVGSTGVQVVTAIASQVKSLHVFIRRPQYTVPSGDRPMSGEERAVINKNYRQIWAEARTSGVAMGFPEPSRTLMSIAPEDREALLESLWQGGNGLRFMFGSFSDIVTNDAANEKVCRFLRKKIAAIVKDPQKRAVLTPTEPYGRRPLCDSGFYEQFNRDNVFAIDVKTHPITDITPSGIRTSDGKLYDLDVLIFATGFDAMEGSYSKVKIHGRESEDLYTRWKRDGPSTYMGISVADFPNLVLLNGPNTGFANFPPLTETNTEFMMDLIQRAEMLGKEGHACPIEATAEAERAWTQLCRASVQGTVFTKVPSWLTGQNMPGKKQGASALFFGGLGRFRSAIADVKARGFEGFKGPGGNVPPRSRL